MRNDPDMLMGDYSDIDDLAGDIEKLIQRKYITLQVIRDSLMCVYLTYYRCGSFYDKNNEDKCGLGDIMDKVDNDSIPPEYFGCGTISNDMNLCQKRNLKNTFKETWEWTTSEGLRSLDCQSWVPRDINKLLGDADVDGAMRHFWDKFEAMYSQLVRNAYDYKYTLPGGMEAEGNTPQWRMSAFEGFRLLIGSLGLVAKTLTTLIEALKDLQKFYTGEFGDTEEDKALQKRFCQPKAACHIYSKFLFTAFGRIVNGNMTLQGSGLPSYIVDSEQIVAACARSQESCNEVAAPWKDFDFSGIPASPLLSRTDWDYS
jgi:hypothetical protein